MSHSGRFSNQWLLLIAVCVAILGVAPLAFWFGTNVGSSREHARMELLKSFGPMTASELLDRGDIRNALSILHVAKAFEVNAGETDQLLSRAYYQRGDFCLAEDYAQSAERYLVEKKMTALEVYTDVQRIERDAAANCERSKKQR